MRADLPDDNKNKILILIKCRAMKSTIINSFLSIRLPYS